MQREPARRVHGPGAHELQGVQRHACSKQGNKKDKIKKNGSTGEQMSNKLATPVPLIPLLRTSWLRFETGHR